MRKPQFAGPQQLIILATTWLLGGGSLHRREFAVIVQALTVLPSLQRPHRSESSSILWSSSHPSEERTAVGLSPSQLLYREQEKLLVERGKLEAKLMEEAPTSILAASVIKGAGSSGGFGGGSKQRGSSNKKKSVSLQAQGHAERLQRDGVIRMDHVLSAATADRLRDYVLDLRAQSERMVQEGRVPSLDCFADVLLQNKRCDLKLPLLADSPNVDPIVGQALYELLVASPVGATIRSLLGPDAVLQELSCLMSDPGSDRQVMHPDTPCSPVAQEAAVLYTCFVALQNVDADMGPTTWLPSTHHYEIHQAFQDDYVPSTSTHSRKDELLRTRPIVLGVLPKGSCGMFDSRLLHCGGANTSDKTRAIFYVSFRNPSIAYSGNPPSIRPELVNQFTLSSLEEELVLFHKGQSTKRIMKNVR